MFYHLSLIFTSGGPNILNILIIKWLIFYVVMEQMFTNHFIRNVNQVCHLQNKCRIPNYFSTIHLYSMKTSEVIQISIQNSCWGFWRAVFSLFNANIMKSEQQSKTSFRSWISTAFTTLKLNGTDTENLTATKPATVSAPKFFCFLPLLQLLTINIFHHSSPAKLLFSSSLFFIQSLLVLQNYYLFCVFD